jgi:hypothetical protein
MNKGRLIGWIHSATLPVRAGCKRDAPHQTIRISKLVIVAPACRSAIINAAPEPLPSASYQSVWSVVRKMKRSSASCAKLSARLRNMVELNVPAASPPPNPAALIWKRSLFPPSALEKSVMTSRSSDSAANQNESLPSPPVTVSRPAPPRRTSLPEDVDFHPELSRLGA